MTEHEQYIKAQDECGIKVGDWVTPWAEAQGQRLGWENSWSDVMSGMIGQKFCVCRINETGIALSADVDYSFPYFSLCKVCKEIKPKTTYKDLCKYLRPFGKVLVRDDNTENWEIGLYSHYDAEIEYEGSEYVFVCSGFHWAQCIPYEGNERYLNTSKNPLKSEDE